MKRITILFAVLAVFLWVGSAWAMPTVVQDGYWGADDHGWQDVIGDTSLFGIDRAEISLSGNILSVAIYSNFAGHGDDGIFSSVTNTSYGQSKGIGFGPLLELRHMQVMTIQLEPFGHTALPWRIGGAARVETGRFMRSMARQIMRMLSSHKIS